jgi:sigma-B regulation protein RsbU (phosphoserine phosphatase)
MSRSSAPDAGASGDAPAAAAVSDSLARLVRRSAGLRLIEQRFWKEIPDGSLGSLYAGVFFSFSSLGFLLDMRDLGGRSVLELLVTSLLIGAMAVLYAYLGIRRPRGFFLAVPLQVVSLLLLRGAFPELAPLEGEALRQRLTLDLVGATLGIAFGYSGFMFFIVRVGSQHVRARAEIALARELHAGLVPPLVLREGGYALCARSEPATEVGGDLVDAVLVDRDVYAVVADVTGHGVRAGSLMGMFKSATRVALRSERELSPLLHALNEVMLPLKSSSLFVTAAFLRLRPGGVVEYALAGHPPILHRLARTGEVRHLSEGGIPIGLLRDQAFPTVEVRLERGDVLAVVTDGVIEVEDAAGRELGLAGLRALLSREPDGPERLLEQLLATASAHGPRIDDQSALVVRYEGPPDCPS